MQMFQHNLVECEASSYWYFFTSCFWLSNKTERDCLRLLSTQVSPTLRSDDVEGDLSAFVSWNIVSPPRWAVWEFLADRKCLFWSTTDFLCSLSNVKLLLLEGVLASQGVVLPQTVLGRGAKRAPKDVETLHFSIFAQGIQNAPFVPRERHNLKLFQTPAIGGERIAPGCSHLSVKETRKTASSAEAMTLRVIELLCLGQFTWKLKRNKSMLVPVVTDCC